MYYHFWMIKWMKDVNKDTFSLRLLLSICLIFCQFQHGVAYKKSVYFAKAMGKTSLQESLIY